MHDNYHNVPAHSTLVRFQFWLHQVQESIAEPMAAWIRFLGSNTAASTVELAIQIQVVAADPVAWGMAIVAGSSQPTPRDQGEVQCGQPFTLEVVAHDKYGHR